MSRPQTLSIKHDGRSIPVTIKRCKIFMASEFAGNVELSLDCDPSLEPLLQDSLALQIPGEEGSVETIASGGPDDGTMLIFHCEAIERLEHVPEHLEFLWCGEHLATVEPELADSIPLEDVHRLINPLKLIEQPEIRASEVFLMCAPREPIWLFLAGMIGGGGVAGSFAPLGFETDLIPYARYAGSVFLVLGAVIALVAYWMPKRQVWFDRNRREVLLVEGRTLSVEKGLSAATRRSVDGFAHVRLCERRYSPDLSSESDVGRTDYIVSLEGPIGFAFDDGRVHSRSDALHLATFTSEKAARRFSAEMGYHAGLQILIATDW